jgi:hypothetical protein
MQEAARNLGVEDYYGNAQALKAPAKPAKPLKPALVGRSKVARRGEGLQNGLVSTTARCAISLFIVCMRAFCCGCRRQPSAPHRNRTRSPLQ